MSVNTENIGLADQWLEIQDKAASRVHWSPDTSQFGQLRTKEVKSPKLLG